MALIRGNTQILDNSINREKLFADFLNGTDLNLTNGNNNATLTGFSDPVNDRDVAIKSYVDTLVQGLKGQYSARVRAQGNVSTLSGTQTIDGVALQDGDQILLDQQTTATEDGLYIVRSGAWDRHPDWSVGESVGAKYVFIVEGTDDNKGFVCTNNTGSDIVGTDDLVFTQFSGAGTIVAGAGLTQNGNAFDVTAADNSLTINANDMQVNIGNTNGTSLEVTASGLELAETVTGQRNFNTGGGDFEIDAGAGDLNATATNINFTDNEVSNATSTTAIPFAMTATVDYGDGNGTNPGDIIDQFRANFTDDAIINALCELKADINASSYTIGNGLTLAAGVVSAGNASCDNITWGMQDNRSISVESENYIGGNHDKMSMQLYAGDSSNSPSISLEIQTNYGADTFSAVRLNDSRLDLAFGADTQIHLENSLADGGAGGILRGGANNWSLDTNPDGTVNLAIATVQYVDNQISASNTRKYNETTSLDIGNQTATLDTAPSTGFSNVVVYLNGVRQLLTTDYTITNAATGEITFTASQPIQTGDVVIIDYSDQ